METTTLVGGQILVGVHSPDTCAGEQCCIHNPSAHHMVEWTQNYRGIMERLCEHNVGHPDPDDPSTDTVHGCDGCCSPPPGREESPYHWPEMDLPGQWSQLGFLGGVEVVRGSDWRPGDPGSLYEHLGAAALLPGYVAGVNPCDSDQDPDEPIGYDGFGAPIYKHQEAR